MNEPTQQNNAKDITKTVIENMIYENAISTVKSLSSNRKICGIISQILIIFKIIIQIIVVPILLFTSVEFSGKSFLTFLGATFSLFGGILETVTMYILKSNTNRTQKINNILKTYGIIYIDEDPTIIDPSTRAIKISTS